MNRWLTPKPVKREEEPIEEEYTRFERILNQVGKKPLRRTSRNTRLVEKSLSLAERITIRDT